MTDMKCKIVLNKDWGGFSLSNEFIEFMRSKTGINETNPDYKFYWPYGNLTPSSEDAEYDKDENLGVEEFDRNDSVMLRSHPFFIDCIEAFEEGSFKVGSTLKSSGSYAEIVVVEVPLEMLKDGYIHDYDGYETFHENHFKA